MTYSATTATVDKAIMASPVFRLIYRSHCRIAAERLQSELATRGYGRGS